MKSTAPGSPLSYFPSRSIFIFRSILSKTQKYLTEFYSLLFPSTNLLQLSPVNLPISGAVTRKGLTTPLTRRVARCCYLCAGVVYVVLLGLLLVRYLGFITEGNTIPSLCYIIPPSPGKYRRSSSYHQASRRNLSNMFTMPIAVPTFQISANNTNSSLNHLSKDLNISM